MLPANRFLIVILECRESIGGTNWKVLGIVQNVRNRHQCFSGLTLRETHMIKFEANYAQRIHFDRQHKIVRLLSLALGRYLRKRTLPKNDLREKKKIRNLGMESGMMAFL
jgi:hypothetical protein